MVSKTVSNEFIHTLYPDPRERNKIFSNYSHLINIVGYLENQRSSCGWEEWSSCTGQFCGWGKRTRVRKLCSSDSTSVERDFEKQRNQDENDIMANVPLEPPPGK